MSRTTDRYATSVRRFLADASPLEKPADSSWRHRKSPISTARSPAARVSLSSFSARAAAHDVVARIAIAGSETGFSATVSLVVGVTSPRLLDARRTRHRGDVGVRARGSAEHSDYCPAFHPSDIRCGVRSRRRGRRIRRDEFSHLRRTSDLLPVCLWTDCDRTRGRKPSPSASASRLYSRPAPLRGFRVPVSPRSCSVPPCASRRFRRLPRCRVHIGSTRRRPGGNAVAQSRSLAVRVRSRARSYGRRYSVPR